MGGRLLNGRRVSRKEADRLFVERVAPKLRRLGVHLFARPVALRSKADFGDIDVIVVGVVGDHIDALRSEHPELSRNDSVVSILVEGVQVDLLFVPEGGFGFARDYYGPFILIGKVARAAGFKISHTGVYALVGPDKRNAFICADMLPVFMFLGLDYSRWQSGFNTATDLIEFAAKSPWWDSEFFSQEMTHGSNTGSMAAFNQMVVEWAKANPKKGLPKCSLMELDKCFGTDLVEMDRKITEQVTIKRWAGKIFNGAFCKKVTGLDGAELGRFMKAFVLNTGLELDEFYRWILDSSDKLEDIVREYHSSVYS